MKENISTKRKQSKKWKSVLLYSITVFALLFFAYIILNKVVKDKVKEKLEQLSPFAKINFSSLRVNPLAPSLSISDVLIKLHPDTTDILHQHVFNFSKAEFEGVNFLSMMFKTNLSVKKLKLNQGNIKFDESLMDKDDSLQYVLLHRMPFKNISIAQFEMQQISVWIYSNGQDNLLLKGIVTADSVEINNLNQAAENNFHFKNIGCSITDIDYTISQINERVQIKQLTIDSKEKGVKIDSLKIIPQVTSNHTNYIKASIPIIELSKFDAVKILDKNFFAESLTINKGDIEVFIEKLNNKNSKHNLQTAKKFLDSMHFTGFSINNFTLAKTKVRLHSKNESRFTIEKIEITDLNNAVANKFDYSSVKCKLSNIHYPISSKYRTLYIKSLIADSKKELLEIDSVRLTTRYSKFELGKKLGHQADYIDASIPSIQISKINFKRLPDKKLIADKAVISNSKVYFFRDRRLPRELKQQPMLNGYLQQIPAEVRINTFKIVNASVVSEEFPKAGNQSGFLKIEKINISQSPLLNHPYKNDPRYSDTYVEGSIMNAGLINATIHASVKEDVCFIKGIIKNLDLPALNPSSENLGKFHIESGILNHLDFDFTATGEKATGEIVGEYHNLVIDRLKQKNGEQKVAKVPTFFLKHLIIPKNKDESLNVAKRTGKIDYKRDSTRLITFYFVKALLDGIRASFDLGFLLPK